MLSHSHATPEALPRPFQCGKTKRGLTKIACWNNPRDIILIWMKKSPYGMFLGWYSACLLSRNTLTDPINWLNSKFLTSQNFPDLERCSNSLLRLLRLLLYLPTHLLLMLLLRGRRILLCQLSLTLPRVSTCNLHHPSRPRSHIC
jgi:hypothetical protein